MLQNQDKWLFRVRKVIINEQILMSAIKAQVDLLGIEPKSNPYIETVLHAYFILSPDTV